jgi:hypothetical protein
MVLPGTQQRRLATTRGARSKEMLFNLQESR